MTRRGRLPTSTACSSLYRRSCSAVCSVLRSFYCSCNLGDRRVPAVGAAAGVRAFVVFPGAGCGEGSIICDGAPVFLALEGPAPVWFALISAANRAFASLVRSSRQMSCPRLAPPVCCEMVSLARCDAVNSWGHQREPAVA